MRIGSIVCLALLVGCGGGTEVTTELKLIAQASRAVNSDRVAGDTSTESVTIDSLKVPIFDISLGTGESLSGGSGNANTLYQCPEDTEAGCYVEMIGEALTNLLTAGNVQGIDAGSYTSVMAATCKESGTYTAMVKAKVEFKGATWYTKTDSATLTQTEAEYSPVGLSFSGCRNYSVLDTPIVIGEAAVKVSLYLDVRNLITVGNKDGAGIANPSGCTSGTMPLSTDPILCMTYPNVVGNIGDTPTLERYRIEPQGGAGTNAKLIGLYFDASSDLPVGGYDRPLFAGQYTDSSSLFGPFKRAYNEARGLVVTDYENANTDVISGDGDNTMRAFPRLSVGQSQDVAVTKGDGTNNGTVKIYRID